MREKRAALGRQGCGKVRVCVHAQEKVGCYCTTLIHSGLKKDKTEKKNLPVERKNKWKIEKIMQEFHKSPVMSQGMICLSGGPNKFLPWLGARFWGLGCHGCLQESCLASSNSLRTLQLIAESSYVSCHSLGSLQ